ncbi:hypothetical protein ACFFQW_02750 [Umezawaea endophytica]|uniref:Uncharacterized protein n=1 Tax=Umezawaea endophytica TaxID=1654476 RepID=A0A9X2VSG9_9PSEU|nr:hypothetical protein [Umezawaea endophytica]MCS7482016.1 hypothetical protein [Umezawaea endophytica]
MNRETTQCATKTENPVEVLGAALDAAVSPLRHLDDPTGPRPVPGEAVNRVLRVFVGTTKPVQAQLAALAHADPHGAVAKALLHVRRAFGHFCADDGLAEGRAELLAARACLEAPSPIPQPRDQRR